MPENRISDAAVASEIMAHGSSFFKKIKAEYLSENVCIAAALKDGFSLRDMPKALMTRKVCIAAVTRDAHELRNIPASLKTDEICLLAFQFGSLEGKSKRREQNGICFDLLFSYLPQNLHNPDFYLRLIDILDKRGVPGRDLAEAFLAMKDRMKFADADGFDEFCAKIMQPSAMQSSFKAALVAKQHGVPEKTILEALQNGLKKGTLKASQLDFSNFEKWGDEMARFIVQNCEEGAIDRKAIDLIPMELIDENFAAKAIRAGFFERLIVKAFEAGFSDKITDKVEITPRLRGLAVEKSAKNLSLLGHLLKREDINEELCLTALRTHGLNAVFDIPISFWNEKRAWLIIETCCSEDSGSVRGGQTPAKFLLSLVYNNVNTSEKCLKILNFLHAVRHTIDFCAGIIEEYIPSSLMDAEVRAAIFNLARTPSERAALIRWIPDAQKEDVYIDWLKNVSPKNIKEVPLEYRERICAALPETTRRKAREAWIDCDWRKEEDLSRKLEALKNQDAAFYEAQGFAADIWLDLLYLENKYGQRIIGGQRIIDLNHIPDSVRSPEFCRGLARISGKRALELPERNLTKDVYEELVKENPLLIRHVPDNFTSSQMWAQACACHPLLLKDLPEKFKNAELVKNVLEIPDSRIDLEDLPRELLNADMAALFICRDKARNLCDIPDEIFNEDLIGKFDAPASDGVPAKLLTAMLERNKLTEKACEAIVKDRPDFIDAIPPAFLTERLAELAVSANGMLLGRIPPFMRSSELCEKALETCKSCERAEIFSMIPVFSLTPKLCATALEEHLCPENRIPGHMRAAEQEESPEGVCVFKL